MKKIICSIICILFIISIFGCAEHKVISTNYNDNNIDIEPHTFKLYYDENTKIVYYMNDVYGGHYVYLPYLSENGKYMKLEDNELIEIDNN